MISFGFLFFLKRIFKSKSLFGKIFFEWLSIFFTVALIYYAGQSFEFKNDKTTRGSNSLFVFLILGEISLVLPMSLSERMISYFQEIKGHQFFQTLLGLNITPEKFILSKSLVDLIFPFIRVLMILFICAVFLGVEFSAFSIITFLGLQLFALVLFLFMALITNLLFLKFNRGVGLFYSLQSLAAIVGGLYFPTSILPSYIRNFSIFLPQTQILKTSRELFESQFLDSSSILILICWMILLMMAYFTLYKYLIENLKRKARFF